MELTDLPRKIPPALYDDTREAVCNTYAEIDGVVDVIEYGGISYPGISDMDFIVVVEPGYEVNLPSLNTYMADQRYVMEHSHYVISAPMLKHLKLFDPFLRTFTPLMGRISTSSLTPLSDEEKRILTIVHPLANWILPLLTLLAKIDCTATLPCRPMLSAMRRPAFCYRAFHHAGFISDATDPDKAYFEQTLEGWFEFHDKEKKERMEDVLQRLRAFIKQFLGIAARQIQTRVEEHRTPDRLKKNHRIYKKNPNSLCFHIEGGTTIFSRDERNMHASFSMFSSPFTSQTYMYTTRTLPLILGAPDIRVLFEDGTFPLYLKRHCTTDLDTIPVFTHPVLQRRTEVMNTLLDDLKNVRGGKLIGRFYGIQVGRDPGGGTVLARLGGIYDRRMRQIIRTPLRRLLLSRTGYARL